MSKKPMYPNQNEVLDLTPTLSLLPGEDEADFEALRTGLLRDLAPSSPYEQVLAQNLVDLEWEFYRYRKLRNDILRKKFVDLAIGALLHGYIGEAHPTPESESYAKALVDPDSELREAARAVLASHDIDEGWILATAYAEEQETLAPFERHIVELEKRRRRLKADFDALKSARARQTIPEAEIVSDDAA